MHKTLLNTYNPLPVQFTHGDGVWLFDKTGKRYLDALCGIAVTGLGHNHPAVTAAIQQQAPKLLHASNLVQIPEQIALGEALVASMDWAARCYFCNSGAEAVEAAIKLARLHGHNLGLSTPKIVVMERAFHGRTMGALSACANPAIQAGFEPLLPGFVRVPYNDIEALTTLATQHADISAVLVEGIQGEAGIRLPKVDYLRQLRSLCDQHQWLLMVDEIQAGLGRSGRWMAYEHAGIKPDAITLAKGLANGVPIGALVVATSFADLFKPGSHGSTFGGNPLSCAAGLATLQTILQQQLWQNAAQQGHRLLAGLREAFAGHPNVVAVRGCGLLIGIELDQPCRAILTDFFKHGLVCNVANKNTIRLLPPLIIETTEVDFILDLIPKVVANFYGIG